MESRVTKSPTSYATILEIAIPDIEIRMHEERVRKDLPAVITLKLAEYIVGKIKPYIDDAFSEFNKNREV